MYALRTFITEIRLARGLQMQALATRLGVTAAAVSAWESARGQRIPSARHFQRILQECRVKRPDQLKAWDLYAAADAEQASDLLPAADMQAVA